MRSRLLPLAVTLLAGFVLPQAAKDVDSLTKSFSRWLRDFKAGKVDPDDRRGPRKEPYLDAELARAAAAAPDFDRLDEARALFRALKKRGQAEDAQRIVAAIEASLDKKGGELWEVTGSLTRFRKVAVQVLEEGCPPAMQEAVAARLKQGLKPLAKPAAGKPAKPGGDLPPPVEGEEQGPLELLAHAEPDLAIVLTPVVAAFNQPLYRPLLEDLLRVEDAGVASLAAAGLATMGYGPSVTAVARRLHGSEPRDATAWLAQALGILIQAKTPAPSDKDLKYALGLVLDRLQRDHDWRARLAIVPITRMIRAKQTVPVLIELLDQDVQQARAPKDPKAPPASSGVLRKAVHEALVDLSGFFAPADQPAQWRSWWAEVQGKFEIGPAKEAVAVREGVTAASQFFGIPVSGSRVVFVLDVSGSMEWPIRTKDYVKGKTGRGAKGSFESRMDRLRKELLRAIEGMPADAEFNVVFFSNEAKAWKKKLVPANAANKKAFAADIEKMHPGGGTALYDGLDEALQIELDPKGKGEIASTVDEVFVLSDGAPTRGKILDPREILEVVRTWNRGAQVRIHTINLGDPVVDDDFTPPGAQRVPGADEIPGDEFMRRLATENFGRCEEPAKRL